VLRLGAFENRLLLRICVLKSDKVAGSGEHFIMWNFITCTLLKYNWNYQVKEDVMGRACSTNGGRGMHVGYWWESQKERDH
jgi:hypothetical protein